MQEVSGAIPDATTKENKPFEERYRLESGSAGTSRWGA